MSTRHRRRRAGATRRGSGIAGPTESTGGPAAAGPLALPAGAEERRAGRVAGLVDRRLRSARSSARDPPGAATTTPVAARGELGRGAGDEGVDLVVLAPRVGRDVGDRQAVARWHPRG